MKNHLTILGILWICASGMLLCGCSFLSEKTHVVTQSVEGDQQDIIDAPREKVVAAANAAVKDLDLIYITTTREPATTQPAEQTITVVARTRNDDKVSIAVQPQGPNSSRVTVNTGFLGDSALRQHVLDKVRAHVNAPSAK